ncbi:MAG: ABC transporter [Deltaproteobacteria bacterium]|nr:ABC transporter ATP-binding protein [Deltaproteobacteria bacterium]RLA90438.1 MAG: ABC transporter [Deltaproteobacteria bacterium]
MITLNIKGISFSYKTIKAIEDITFEGKGGEIIGIIGPNGSGKSTLLRCINRNLSPQIGTVLLDGTDISKLSRNNIACKFGVVPQNSIINLPFSGMEIVLMGRYPRIKRYEYKDEDFNIAEEVMKVTGTLELSNKLFTEMSGGEKQRLIIARCLAQEPEVLLLDEPTLHLDIKHQFEIMEFIHHLSREKKLLVIVVSHDINLAINYCDKLILLSDGKIFTAGNVKDVIIPENLRKVFHVEAKLIKDIEKKSFYIVFSPLN